MKLFKQIRKGDFLLYMDEQHDNLELCSILKFKSPRKSVDREFIINNSIIKLGDCYHDDRLYINKKDLDKSTVLYEGAYIATSIESLENILSQSNEDVTEGLDLIYKYKQLIK